MFNKDDSAMPQPILENNDEQVVTAKDNDRRDGGLSKHEYAVIAIAAGFAARGPVQLKPVEIADLAVRTASHLFERMK